MKEIAYSVDLQEKAVSLIEKGKSKDEFRSFRSRNSNIIQVDEKESYRRKPKTWENGYFIRKIDQEMLAEYVKNTKITR